MPTIIVNSLEEVTVDGKASGTVLDVAASSDKDTLWKALCAWRDKFLTDKAAEIQNVVHLKETAEADLATATATVAEHGAIFETIASAGSLDEVKAAIPISEEDLKAKKVADLEEQLAAAKADLPTE